MKILKMFYSLQICRGLAAIIVLLCHANIIIDKTLFSGFFVVAWHGVDFFFVLSGFIVYYTNSKSFGKTNDFGIYLKKRLIRIFPIYWVYSIPVILLHLLIISFTGLKLVSWFDFNVFNVTKSLLLYPADFLGNKMPIIPVAWTLSSELLFYIVFGICILIPRHYLIYITVLWLIGIGLTSLKIIDTSGNYFLVTLLAAKNLEFILGCVLAEIILRGKIINNFSVAVGVVLIGIVLLLLSWINEWLRLDYLVKVDVIKFGIPYAIIIYGLISIEFSRKIKTTKNVFVYLGNASYSIYLTHYIIITLLFAIVKKLTDINYIIFTIAVILSVIFGCLCYSFIEKPLLKFLNNRAGLTKRVKVIA